jgi:hypothetical protein
MSDGVTNVQKTLRITSGCIEEYTCRQIRQKKMWKNLLIDISVDREMFYTEMRELYLRFGTRTILILRTE